jgi:hypothetical protein
MNEPVMPATESAVAGISSLRSRRRRGDAMTSVSSCLKSSRPRSGSRLRSY